MGGFGLDEVEGRVADYQDDNIIADTKVHVPVEQLKQLGIYMKLLGTEEGRIVDTDGGVIAFAKLIYD